MRVICADEVSYEICKMNFVKIFVDGTRRAFLAANGARYPVVAAAPRFAQRTACSMILCEIAHK